MGERKETCENNDLEIIAIGTTHLLDSALCSGQLGILKHHVELETDQHQNGGVTRRADGGLKEVGDERVQWKWKEAANYNREQSTSSAVSVEVWCFY